MQATSFSVYAYVHKFTAKDLNAVHDAHETALRNMLLLALFMAVILFCYVFVLVCVWNLQTPPASVPIGNARMHSPRFRQPRVRFAGVRPE